MYPYPQTTWPGMPSGGMPPSMASGMLGHTPMFAMDPGHTFTGPFNFGGGNMGMLQMLMPAIMSGFTGGGFAGQFFPQQNLYDQMEATRHFMDQQSAMQDAANRDMAAMQNMLGGVQQMMTGQPLTQAQEAQNFRMSQMMNQFMPVMTQLLGPDMVDRLHGSRGSATVFAQQIHNAMRTSLDPVTGMVGYSGSSSGRVTQEIYDNLYGPDANIDALRGMSAGQAGILAGELQARGMLGTPMGAMSFQEQRAALPQQLADDLVNRIAETLPEIRDVLAEGGTPSEAMLQQARDTVRDSHSQLIDPAQQMFAEDLEDMPGGQEIIRAADADRISSKLRNLSGAVKAMRDIFGDMGNPNAPMRELINGLEALTQGGLSTMNPGDLEMMVRRTQTIARQTGIGVGGMMGLMQGQFGAPLADALGLDRSYVVSGAQGAALYGAAAGSTLRMDIPVWGAMSQEQLTLADQQLRMHAAASPLANQMNAMLRMADTGMLNAAAGTETAAMLDAIRQGKDAYTFNGKSRSVAMAWTDLTQMMERDGGVSAAEAYTMLSDYNGNQEFGQKYNTTNVIRKIQAMEALDQSISPMLGHRYRGILAGDGADQTLISSGAVVNEADVAKLADDIGSQMGLEFLKMDEATVRDPEARRKALGEAYRKNMRAALQARMPDAGAAEIDALLDQVAPASEINAIGEATYATINAQASKNPIWRNAQGFYGLNNERVMEEAASRGRQASATAMRQSAMSHLGASGPIQRLMDAVQTADSDTDIGDLITDTLGGVEYKALMSASPDGPVAALLGLAQDNNRLDPRDEAEFAQIQRNTAIMKALVDGGPAAEAEAKKMRAARLDDGSFTYGSEELLELLDAAGSGQSVSAQVENMGAMVGATMTDEQIATMAGGQDLEGEDLDVWVEGAGARARSLMGDRASMEGLGRGGLALAQTLSQSTRELEGLAAEHGVTVSELLDGKAGRTARKKAQALYDKATDAGDEIAERREEAGGFLPGKGSNDQEAMTQSEKDALDADLRFRGMHGTRDARSEAALDQLSSVMSAEDAAMLQDPTSRKRLLEAMTEGDRGGAVARMGRNTEEMLRMGLSRGAFGDKTNLSQLTDDERASAYDLISDLDLTDEERADLERMQEGAGGMSGLGTDADGADLINDLLGRIGGIQGAAPEEKTEDQKMTITLKSGNLTLNEDGTATVEGEGEGIIDRMMSAVGIG